MNYMYTFVLMHLELIDFELFLTLYHQILEVLMFRNTSTLTVLFFFFGIPCEQQRSFVFAYNTTCLPIAALLDAIQPEKINEQ